MSLFCLNVKVVFNMLFVELIQNLSYSHISTCLNICLFMLYTKVSTKYICVFYFLLLHLYS